MPLQTSGAISLANIQTEFGGSNPASLSEYYAGGAYVPAGCTGTNGAVPSSGSISLFRFYGTSATLGYVEDLFSADTYVGTGSALSIVNGIDLANKGGMVWIKDRGATWQGIILSSMGSNSFLIPSSFSPQGASTELWNPPGNTNGFTVKAIGSLSYVNVPGNQYAAWTFRKQAKFFDMGSYTGNGSAYQTVSHNLGSTPGMIIVKCTNYGSTAWYVYHRSMIGSNESLQLQGSGYATTSGVFSSVGSTNFVVSNELKTNGYTYNYYMFAHNESGFGSAGTDTLIKCDTFVTDGSGLATVDLGWEPQFLLVKSPYVVGSWKMIDTTRGLCRGAYGTDTNNILLANSTAAESSDYGIYPTATGFGVRSNYGTNTRFVYLAIRRGLMKTPTTASKVFKALYMSSASGTQTTGFPVDMQMQRKTGADTYNYSVHDRLRGFSSNNGTNTCARISIGISTAAEDTNWSNAGTIGWTSTGFDTPSYYSGGPHLTFNFRRARGFFDIVTYTGTGSNRTINHNLGVVPEFMIIRHRYTSSSTTPVFYHKDSGYAYNHLGGSTGSWTFASYTSTTTTPTATQISLGTSNQVNASGGEYVAYLFGSVPGVSSIGSYTGSGAARNMDFGFSNGASFVLVARRDANGMTIFNSARGIGSGNDPYGLLQSPTSAEVTSLDPVYAYSGGIGYNEIGMVTYNGAGYTYYYLAIA